MAGKASNKGRRQATSTNSQGRAAPKGNQAAVKHVQADIPDSKLSGTELPLHNNQESMKVFVKRGELCSVHDMSSQAGGGTESPSEPSTPKTHLSASTRKKKNRKERERAAKGQSRSSSPRVSVGDSSDSAPSPPQKAQDVVQKQQCTSAAQVTLSLDVKDEQVGAVNGVFVPSASPPANRTSATATDEEKKEVFVANGLLEALSRKEVAETTSRGEDLPEVESASAETTVALPSDNAGLVMKTDTHASDMKTLEPHEFGSSADVKLQNMIKTGNVTEDEHAADTAVCGAGKIIQSPDLEKPPVAIEKSLTLPMNMLAKEKLCGAGANETMVLQQQLVEDAPRVLDTGKSQEFVDEEVKVISVGVVDIQEADVPSRNQSNSCLNSEPGNTQEFQAPEDLADGGGTEAVCERLDAIKRPLPHEDHLPCLPCGVFLDWFQSWFGPRARVQQA